MIRGLLTVTVLLVLGGCFAPEPSYRNVEVMPHEWDVEPEYPLGHEHMVSEAMLYTELADYSEQMQRSGWRIEGPYSAGEYLPGKYYVVLSRPK